MPHELPPFVGGFPIIRVFCCRPWWVASVLPMGRCGYCGYVPERYPEPEEQK